MEKQIVSDICIVIHPVMFPSWQVITYILPRIPIHPSVSAQFVCVYVCVSPVATSLFSMEHTKE